MLPMLLAVHIADGVLEWPWLVGGFIVAIVLVTIAAYRVRDEEIPRIGLFAAAIFVGSQLHIPLGITSVHLLLNGLTGLMLGYRAPLAIAVGLTLQSFLFGHGGKLSLGVNLCVLAIPALLAGLFIPIFQQMMNRHRWFEKFIVLAAILTWLAITVTAIQIIVWKYQGLSPRSWLEDPTQLWLANIWTALVIIMVSATATAFVKRNLAHGLLIGGGCALLTVVLNVIVVSLGGLDGIRSAAVVTLLAHLPVVTIEAMGVAAIMPMVVKQQEDKR